MTAILFALVALAALLWLLWPLRGREEPFPEPPRREDLLAELALLKEEARTLEGEEKKAALARIVRLEKALEGYRPAQARRPSPWALVGALLVLLGTGYGLWRYTLPRLPGETLVTARQEAQALRALADRARRTGSPEDLLAWGRKAWELQAFDQAAEAYLELVKKDPRNAEAIRRVGILLFMSGRAEEAVPFLQIAAHADPQAAEAWLFLGNAYFQLGQNEEAIGAWERYLEVGGEARERVENLIATVRAKAEGGLSGQGVFLSRCAACHGAEAQGGVGPALKGNPLLKSEEAVREIVLKGRGQMPPVPLSEEELQALLAYLKTL
ncbi:c-type cytochrome [Thermus filiformis]|uniref:Cystathionine beta-synthase n=1 Tax=Thermus filiformis TaxID=276 RepID=A0A0A2WS61_THEFI|nr:cytochrome c [Thermus filiformis]KGQ23011.1 cystathionine beta-synthase [Thermus filiformis]